MDRARGRRLRQRAPRPRDVGGRAATGARRGERHARRGAARAGRGVDARRAAGGRGDAGPTAPAPALAFGDLGPCPAPHTTRPSGALRQPQLDDELVGFAGAPTDSRWIAAWSRSALFVSRDGGASWDRVLDGHGDLLDASFDCHGRVLALRDGHGLGIRDGAREAWRVVPGVTVRIPDSDDDGYRAELVGGGRGIAVLGPLAGEDDPAHANVALSDDGGATWRHADLGWYEGKATGHWTGDTLRVLVPWTDCMSEGLRLVTVGPGGTRSQELDEWMSQVAMDKAGVVFGVSEFCYERFAANNVAICVWRQGGTWRPIATDPVPGRDDGYGLYLVDGPADVLLRFDVVQSLSGAKLGRARAWPEGAEPLGTDLAGRLWGKGADGTLMRR